MLASVLLLAVLPTACDDAPTRPTDDAIFRVQACQDQFFRIRLTDPQLISRAEDLIGAADQAIVNGAISRGTGGFNSPWSWHLEPGTIEFADLTTEVCDGCPAMVEQNLGYWVNTVGRFCPWTSRIVARAR
jgi:hypothetical protein